jgi:hypothetical protein
MEGNPLEKKVSAMANGTLSPEQIQLTAKLVAEAKPENEDEFITKSIEARVAAAAAAENVAGLKVNPEDGTIGSGAAM